MGKCKVCKEKTKVIFNINLKATNICEDCATAIFLQQAKWYTQQQAKIISSKPFVMPSLLAFKARREMLELSLRDVADKTGVSAATISRIERGNEADYGNVKTLHEWYASNGA